MGRYKIQILSVLCGALFMLQGCVHGTLDECPPMVQYAVAFTYTNHTGKTDRFYSDVKKINLFVFDENNLIYTTTTKISPYETNFNIPLDIPMGKYHIIAWGNVLDDNDFSLDPLPEDFVIGETTLDEAKLILQRYTDALKGETNINGNQLDELFYGEYDAEIPLYISRVDTIPLTNNTNNVRVVLHWDLSKVSNEEAINVEKVVVRLEGTNAMYDFSNNRISTPIIYKPYATYYSDSIVKTDTNKDWQNIYYYDDSVKTESKILVYDFTVLRLFKDVPLNLIVQYWEPTSDGGYIRNNVANVDLISRSTGFEYLFSNGSPAIIETKWQDTFDKYERYKVDMYILQGSKYYDSFSSGGIHINDWHVIYNPDGAGM